MAAAAAVPRPTLIDAPGSPMAQPTMTDWFDINNLFVRYATSLDHADVEAVARCFTEDAVLESPVMGTFAGRAGIRGSTELLSPGEYACDLARVDGQWLFARRVVSMDRPFAANDI